MTAVNPAFRTKLPFHLQDREVSKLKAERTGRGKPNSETGLKSCLERIDWRKEKIKP
jgi:hypothetical protein